ncbi:MAG TPA: aminotransferase class V-fold PLP-dependent enzyme [Pseudonocardiaceae bacterium]
MRNHLWGEDWAAARARWEPADDVVHLNHGSFGAVPVAARAEQGRLREQMERAPDRWFRGLAARVAAARLATAEYLGTDPAGLALVPNASAGVTVALDALRAAPGDVIVYTDHAYGAVELAIGRVCARLGLRPRRVHVPLAAPAGEVVELLGAALDGACLLVVDQVTSATARVFPVAELGALCRERGVPLLVDGAHAPGMLAGPVPDVDLWAGNLHKWSCAPRGTGAVVASAPWRDRLRPPITSWNEAEPFPARFDVQGTVDLTGWLAAPVSYAELAALGADRVRRHNAALAGHAQQVLAAALDTAPAEVADPAPSMRLVPLPPGVGTTPAECQALQARVAGELRCEVALTSWRGQGFLRLSAHVHNCPADYAVLAERLPEWLRRN